MNPVAEQPSTPVSEVSSQADVYSDAEACGVAVADDAETLPVAQRFSHLKTVGALLTAHQCGTSRLDALFGGEEAMYIAASRVVLSADATDADREVLERIGYRCEDGRAPCVRYTLRRPVPVAELLRVSDIATRIEQEDCIECAPSATKTYTDADVGLSFDYPVRWGDVRVSRELVGIDAGKRVTLGFTDEERVSLTAASVDYSEGVGEGTPMYFTVRPGSADFSSAQTAAMALAQPFRIVSWEPIADGIYRMTHDASRYGGDVRMVSYLFPARANPQYATLMVNASADQDIRSDVEALVRSVR